MSGEPRSRESSNKPTSSPNSNVDEDRFPTATPPVETPSPSTTELKPYSKPRSKISNRRRSRLPLNVLSASLDTAKGPVVSPIEARERRILRLQESQPELAQRFQNNEVHFLTSSLRKASSTRRKKSNAEDESVADVSEVSAERIMSPEGEIAFLEKLLAGGVVDRGELDTTTADGPTTKVAASKVHAEAESSDSEESSSSSTGSTRSPRTTETQAMAEVRASLNQRASLHAKRSFVDTPEPLSRAERMRRTLEAANPELLHRVETGSIKFLSTLQTKHGASEEGDGNAAQHNNVGAKVGGDEKPTESTATDEPEIKIPAAPTVSKKGGAKSQRKTPVPQRSASKGSTPRTTSVVVTQANSSVDDVISTDVDALTATLHHAQETARSSEAAPGPEVEFLSNAEVEAICTDLFNQELSIMLSDSNQLITRSKFSSVSDVLQCCYKKSTRTLKATKRGSNHSARTYEWLLQHAKAPESSAALLTDDTHNGGGGGDSAFRPSASTLKALYQYKVPARMFIRVRRRRFTSKIPAVGAYLEPLLPGIPDLELALKRAEEEDAVKDEDVMGVDYSSLWGEGGRQLSPQCNVLAESDAPTIPKAKGSSSGKGAKRKQQLQPPVNATTGLEGSASKEFDIALLNVARTALDVDSNVGRLLQLVQTGRSQLEQDWGAASQVSPLWNYHRQLPLHSLTPLPYLRDDFLATKLEQQDETTTR